MKSFTTTQDMTQYEVSQDYCEPYLGATHDDLQAARFNKYDTHIDKNEFFIYDDVNHKYNIYRKVEYIENTSNAYINTGINGSMDLNFYIEFLPTELATAYKSGAGSIFGSRSAYNSRAYQLTTYNKVSPYDAAKCGHFLCANNYGWSNSKAPTANMLLNQKNIIKKENLIFTRADGSTFTLTSQTFTTAATITIFQCAGAGEPAKIKLYKLQFSRGSNVLRDFIPVKNTLTNQYGLLDTVEQKFYVSPNGVEFNGGNEIIDIMEIHPKLIANTYIDQNTGNQQGYNGWSSSDYIDVEGFNYIQMPYPFRDSDYKYGAYYDKDKKRISNTASLTIPSNAKYVRLSSTTSNFTNVWLFKKQLITTDIYRANSYVETNGIIKSYNGWNILNTDSEYNYFYCWIYAQNYRYQAAYNADGSVYQSGSGFLQKPEGGKVLLSDGNTSITYYAGYNYMYKDMNK